MFKGIDLHSDTATRPSPAMRQAMANAEVGDEQRGEDPTTRRLEERVAELLGKSAALFLPSATMANEIALLELGQPGDEILAAENCHLFLAETGGPAAHAGLMVKAIATSNGLFTPDDIHRSFRFETGPLYSISKILSVENTTNMGGGIAWPLPQLQSVVETARLLKMQTHLDGARLLNAATASQVPARELTRGFETVTLCLSKGLGCPAGACLAFDEKRWPNIRRLKQRMGGSLRQSGILAAAGLYALDHHVTQLAVDHENSRILARELQQVSGIDVENPLPSTNMTFFRLRSTKYAPPEFLAVCEKRGVRFSQVGANRFRAVTHRDVTAGNIASATGILKEICN